MSKEKIAQNTLKQTNNVDRDKKNMRNILNEIVIKAQPEMGGGDTNTPIKHTEDITAATGKPRAFACFTADTLVHTINGLIPIKDIRVGDWVYCYNEANESITIREVSAVFNKYVEEVLEIKTETEIIKTIRTHLFYVNGKYKEIEQVKSGASLFTKNRKNVNVVGLNHIVAFTKVYTIGVTDHHCYFVGTEGALVSSF